MRAVLDPNVIISAALSSGGPPAQLVRAWGRGEFELVISPQLLDELERALAYPKLLERIDADDAAAILGLLREEAELREDPPEPAPIGPDPGDDYLIALSAAEGAALVSGDRHLLGLADRSPILTPRQFLDQLPDAG